MVTEIAKKHDKTPAQILLRFLVQQELVVIPKSTNPERLQQNIEVRMIRYTRYCLNSLKYFMLFFMFWNVLDFRFQIEQCRHATFRKSG